MLDDVLRALMHMPAGQVAIPQIYRDSWTEAAATFRGLGLVMERRDIEGIASAISTAPPAGVAVTRGSTVIVVGHH